MQCDQWSGLVAFLRRLNVSAKLLQLMGDLLDLLGRQHLPLMNEEIPAVARVKDANPALGFTLNIPTGQCQTETDSPTLLAKC